MQDWYWRSYGDFSSSSKVKIQISNFFGNKFKFLGSHGVVTREDLSIGVSITNVGQILTKLWWFQLFVESQNSNFELFWKQIQIFRFPWCRTRENLSIDVTITNVGLILTKLGWFLFSGYGQMDRRTDRQTWFWNPHMEHVGTQKISTQSSKLVVSCRSLYASPEDGDA